MTINTLLASAIILRCRRGRCSVRVDLMHWLLYSCSESHARLWRSFFFKVSFRLSVPISLWNFHFVNEIIQQWKWEEKGKNEKKSISHFQLISNFQCRSKYINISDQEFDDEIASIDSKRMWWTTMRQMILI